LLWILLTIKNNQMLHHLRFCKSRAESLKTFKRGCDIPHTNYVLWRMKV
jgi:hypothetical protein